MNHIVAFSRPAALQHQVLHHPSGLVVPAGPVDLRLMGDGLVADLVAGRYAAREIAAVQRVLRPQDRVLDLGAGLGLTSAAAAQIAGVARVIALEPSPLVQGLMARVHDANPGEVAVERVQGLPGLGRLGYAPFYLRRDLRRSSMQAQDGLWEQVVEAAFVDLDLILAEEAITVLVADLPSGLAGLLARADLGRLRALVLTAGPEAGRLVEVLARRGFAPDVAAGEGPVLVFRPV